MSDVGNKPSRRSRARYALSKGKQAYRSGKDRDSKPSKLTRTRRLLLGRSGSGFLGRVGLLGITGAGIGTYKIGGNAVRSAQNIERTTQSVANTAFNVENSTSRINSLVDSSINWGSRAKAKASAWGQKAKNWAARERRFNYKSNNQNFMNRDNRYANFSADQLEEALEATLEEIEQQYEDGLLTDEEADELEEEALDEFEELGEDLEDEYEDNVEYGAYNGTLANFSAGTALGGALMEHVVAIDPYNPEETILDLADSLGLVDEEGYELEGDDAIAGVLGLMSGEVVPDESLLEGLSNYLELDDEEADEIYDLAEDELEEAGYEDDDEYYEDELAPGEYYDEQGNIVADLENEIEGLEGELDEVGEVAEEAFSRIANMEAQFAAAQEQNNIAHDFEMLERDAYSLVESGQMPPAIFEDNYGNFASRDDRMAAFSQVCSSRGVDSGSELYRLEGLNETYAQMEPNINFSQMSYADTRTNDYHADDATLAQAARNVRARLSNNQFGQPIDFGTVPTLASGIPGAIPSQIEGQPSVSMSNLNNYAPANPRDLSLGGYARSF